MLIYIIILPLLFLPILLVKLYTLYDDIQEKKESITRTQELQEIVERIEVFSLVLDGQRLMDYDIAREAIEQRDFERQRLMEQRPVGYRGLVPNGNFGEQELHMRLYNQNNYNFQKWLDEKFTYTSEDILYYFSEFTDQYEYEYSVNRIGNGRDDISNINYYEYNFGFESPLKKFLPQPKDLDNEFSIKYLIWNNKVLIESLTQFDQELNSFNICLHQFQNHEENIIDLKVKVDCFANRSKIIINFKKVISTDIINQYQSETSLKN